MFPEAIAVASHNEHKLREIERICRDWPVRWHTVHDHDAPWPVVEETGASYVDNARLKARAVAEALGLPALADDSGIEVDALNLRHLMRAVAGVPGAGRTARYRCVAVLAFPDGAELQAEGVCDGILIAKRKGSGGFGYDPIFVPAGWDRTMAELAPEEKDRISHRGRALRALRGLVAD